MIQKQNLLKLLLNKPSDTPGENVPSYSDTIVTDNGLGDKITAIYGAGYFATPYRILSKNNRTIAYNDETIIVNNTEVIQLANYNLHDLIQDDNGLYAVISHTSKVFLAYLYDDFSIKIEYDITTLLKDITGDPHPEDITSNGFIKINKSTLDGRFLIATALKNQSYFSVIEYQIVVGGDNTYKYQRVTKSSFTTSDPLIDDMYVSWTEDNVQYAIGIIGRSSGHPSKSNYALYEITGTMSTISYSTLANLQGILEAPSGLKVNYTPQIRYRTMTDRFYSYATVKTSSHVEGGITWYDGDVVMTRLNGSDRTELLRTTTEYMSSSQESSYKNEADIVILNDNVFVIETILTSPTKIQATFKQLIGNTLRGKVVLSDINYDVSNIAFTQISNDFNLYRYAYQLGNNLYSIYSVFRRGYNGVGYFDKDCLSPESAELNDITGETAFARDLYNKSVVGDTINSVLHVPSVYLNETPIMEEKLISKTNLTIDSEYEEIEKNEYEELYVNFTDTYKVWDKNGKSTYQQRASYETTKQISEGFKMYIGGFRVTNNDGTIVKSNLNNIPIVDGEGVIKICFQVRQGKAKTIEITDQNYDVVFASIDISHLSPGAYKLTEKVKVEG